MTKSMNIERNRMYKAMKNIEISQINKMNDILNSFGMKVEFSSLLGLDISYTLPYNSQPEIIKISSTCAGICIHTVSSNWSLKKFESESKEALYIMDLLKNVIPELIEK